ncbi:GGDEF domain-containing protein [Qipengyuania marisflavi]|uniref:diguanylate cyclase n=1 Tax=Qipengyuania marisflavi TaxID=2486356 RepID=A0A5S3P9B6_9SPHN|nr:diguanylate cyclase [Qipengyuania marisflavi]TMM50102.1 diguanylate cyclase [Qipengyuania marisflavi]
MQSALELSQDGLDCGDGRFDTDSQFVRVSSDLRHAFLPAGDALDWETNPTSFDAMLLRFTYADGSEALIDVDPQMAARNWRANTRFAVPVPHAKAMLISIDAMIERPRALTTMTTARLVEHRVAAHTHFLRVGLTMLVGGMLLVPIFYNMWFYRALSARFMLWHSAMSAMMLLYVASNSGLVFEIMPNLPLHLRFQLNSLSMTLAIICAVGFTVDHLESGMVSSRWQRAILAAVSLVFIVQVVTLFDIEAIRPASRPLYIASFVPLGITLMGALVLAARRRSRAAVFVTIAFSALALLLPVALLEALGFIHIGAVLDDLVTAALVLMVLATSAAVGDRFMVIRTRLDRARNRVAQLSVMANTDGLTGLANRRSFGNVQRLHRSHGLIVLDIDRFKRINDSFGHPVGDAVLCHVARIMREALEDQPKATAFRLGGEEFAAIIPVSSEEELRQRAEGLRASIAAGKTSGPMEMPNITVSIGAVLSDGLPLAEAYSLADAAMYRAKSCGRNQTVLASDEIRPEERIDPLDLADRNMRF